MPGRPSWGAPDDLDQLIRDFIGGATKTLLIAVQELDSRTIAEAILSATAMPNLRVQLILEGDYLLEKPPLADPWALLGANETNRLIHAALLRAGVDVLTDLNPEIFHQKFIVRDPGLLHVGPHATRCTRPRDQPMVVELGDHRLGAEATTAGVVTLVRRRYSVKFGVPRTGVAAGGAPDFGGAFFLVGGAIFVAGDALVGDGGAVVVVVGLVVEAVVVVDGGGLPTVVCARATLAICGATQTAALAARPALTVAFASSRRVNPSACSLPLPPRRSTLRIFSCRAFSFP